MKRLVVFLLVIALVSSLFSCVRENTDNEENVLVDDLGNSISCDKDTAVAALHASFAHSWLLAGGKLCALTLDAVEDHGINADGAMIVGTAKSVDREKIVASGARVALLSLDLTAHLEARADLEALGIKCAFFRMDSFSDYASVMRRFCDLTGRDDLYKSNVDSVSCEINAVKDKIPDGEGPRVLLLRAYSSGLKAKRDDNLAGLILSELRAENVADDEPSMLEDVSLEYIVAKDPEYIFVLTMGSEQSALQYIDLNFKSNPAWQDLSAVKDGKYHVLPKDLFHYKPCERWGESYEYIAKIIYKEIFN